MRGGGLRGRGAGGGLILQEKGAGWGALGVIRKRRASLALPVGCRRRGMSLVYPTLCSSCVSPGGSGGQKLAQLPELASAEMSLHAIYLHQVSREVQKRDMWGESNCPKWRLRRGEEVPNRSWQEVSESSAPSPGPGSRAGGSPHSSSFYLAPSAAAAAGTVGRGLRLLPVQALVQPPADTLS